MARLRRSHPDEAAAVHLLLTDAAHSVPVEWFVVDPMDFVARHFDGTEGFTLVAEDAGDLVAALIVRFPRDADDNLARDLGYDNALAATVAHIESVAVVASHRGHGLQRALLSVAEAELVRRGIPLVLATVAPDNVPSLRNFTRAGYVERARRVMYGGLDRIVVGKELA